MKVFLYWAMPKIKIVLKIVWVWITCLYCTHVTSPTQINRALERISLKPMVDGLLKSFRGISEWVRWKKCDYNATLTLPSLKSNLTALLQGFFYDTFTVQILLWINAGTFYIIWATASYLSCSYVWDEGVYVYILPRFPNSVCSE